MQFNIGDFLSKFKTLVPHGKTVKDELICVVCEETGIVLLAKEISFHSNVVFIKASQATKNELFMKKQQILSKIKKKLGDKSLSDIR